MNAEQIAERLRFLGTESNRFKPQDKAMFNEAADLLERMAWVSVKDGLPPRGVKVDVWAGGRRIPDAEICDWISPRSDWSTDSGLISWLTPVTYWRKRPDPPSE